MAEDNGMQIVNKIEWTRKMAQIDQATRNEISLKVVVAGGTVIEKYGKLNADQQGLRGTGLLINSIQVYDEDIEGTTAVCFVGSRGVIYNTIHEFGGTIKAKRVKNLAIPMTETARRAGSPTTMKLKFIPSKKGKGGVLIDQKGTLQFVLVPSVVIPARPYMRPAADEHQSEIVETMGNNLDIELQRLAI